MDQPDSKLSLTVMGYGSGWHGSGQIPLREVLAGRLDPFGSEDPSEGGNSQRQSASLLYSSQVNGQDQWNVSAYVINYRLALFLHIPLGLTVENQDIDAKLLKIHFQ